MEVVRHDLGLDREQALEVVDAGHERAQRLVVLEIAHVVPHPGVPALRDREGVLQLGAAREHVAAAVHRQRRSRSAHSHASAAGTCAAPPRGAPPSRRCASRSAGRASGRGRRCSRAARRRPRRGRRSARRTRCRSSSRASCPRPPAGRGGAASTAASRRAPSLRGPRPPPTAASAAPGGEHDRPRALQQELQLRRPQVHELADRARGPAPSARTACPRGACGRAARPPPPRRPRGTPGGTRRCPSPPRSRRGAARGPRPRARPARPRPRPRPRPRTRAGPAARSRGTRSAARESGGPPGRGTPQGRPGTSRTRPSSCSAGRRARPARW